MNKKGFTLVELLGVIVILGIIITIVATKGFGAFDNTKAKINEENLNTIKEAANLLMTEVKNCDESIDSILIEKFVGIGKNCNDLEEKASTKDANDECLKITLKYLLENDYVSGSGIESIYKEYPDFYANACIDNEEVKTNVVMGGNQ